MKFPFDRYKMENWDIEHVFSQTDIELKGEGLKEFVRLILEYFTGRRIEDIDGNERIEMEHLELFEKLLEIYHLLEKKNTHAEAKKKYEKIKNKLTEAFKEDKIKDGNNISNLVLLDATTNRSYKNAFYPIKRMVIIEKIKNGYFVPIGTQNVFLKAFSRKFENIMFWTNDDAEDYLNAIKDTFKKYFNGDD